MKTSSWEIIIAGFIFVGIAIYLVEQNSDAPSSSTSVAADSIQVNFEGDRLRVIHLKNLKNLENLENLENLSNLKNLRNLKNLTNFLPAEIQADFESEIDEVIKEFEQESVEVNVDTEKGTISINKAVSVTTGSWNAVTPGVFAYVNEFDAANLEEAALNLPFGSISINGTKDTHAKLTIQASGQVSTKAELQSKINTFAEINNNKASFKITPRNAPEKDQNIHLQATLSIPENIHVTSVTDAGHISSDNIHGNQVYQTQGGHITLKEVSGEVEAKTSGGHISVKDSDGNLNLHSMGGHIRTQNSTGSIIMKTSGGNLEAMDVSGAVEASTNGGNIEIQFRDITGNSQANTGAGTITLWVSKSSNARFELSGSSIEIAPELNFQGQTSDGQATGTIGDGNFTINAKTNYGKVILKSGD